ncbi:MAG TPA: CBS domain-containing protein [Stellaceae bacterium]|nr:CBS domain-containing protein [Stellaceae bacterium]
MKAREIMNSSVVAVRPDMPVNNIAKTLREHRISAVPVINEAGSPLGMVSEGDLIGRDQADREARLDWWLSMLAEGEPLSADFVESVRSAERRASDVMTAPVVTVGEETEIGEVARLLTAHRIKRVPVLRDGRIVGIVSRADLVRALAESKTQLTGDGGQKGTTPTDAVGGLEQPLLHRQSRADRVGPAEPPPESDETAPMAADFRQLMADHERQEALHREEYRRVAAEQRRLKVTQLIDHHISDENWRGLLHQARQAAERGEKELLLLRFPSQLCGDAGRAVNAGEPNWPASLRGEASEIYGRWQRDLRPHGFRLGARVLEFPGGMPGDIGLFVTWAQ